MKVMTILGTRPETIRLSRIIPKLDNVCNSILVHTGQNYDENLSNIFFKQLGIREPDWHMEVGKNIDNNNYLKFYEQIGVLLRDIGWIFEKEKPDKVLILGDTNSCLSAIVAKRMGIPVYHMEAGNRCYVDNSPEEINRKIIDHVASVHLPYTELSKQNLIREGIHPKNIFVTGNPIYEVMCHYEDKINSSNILSEIEVEQDKYILVSIHRQENLNDDKLIKMLMELNKEVNKQGKKLVFGVHPRTLNKFPELNDENFTYKPFGFFDFVYLESCAHIILTDSGTVQEECCIMNKPCITLREGTERYETIEKGSNIIINSKNIEDVIDAIEYLTEFRQFKNVNPPREYIVENVSDVVISILLEKRDV